MDLQLLLLHLQFWTLTGNKILILSIWVRPFMPWDGPHHAESCYFISYFSLHISSLDIILYCFPHFILHIYHWTFIDCRWHYLTFLGITLDIAFLEFHRNKDIAFLDMGRWSSVCGTPTPVVMWLGSQQSPACCSHSNAILAAASTTLL